MSAQDSTPAGTAQIRVSLGQVEVTDTDRRAVAWSAGERGLSGGGLADRAAMQKFLRARGEQALESCVRDYLAAGGETASMESQPATVRMKRAHKLACELHDMGANSTQIDQLVYDLRLPEENERFGPIKDDDRTSKPKTRAQEVCEHAQAYKADERSGAAGWYVYEDENSYRIARAHGGLPHGAQKYSQGDAEAHAQRLNAAKIPGAAPHEGQA